MVIVPICEFGFNGLIVFFLFYLFRVPTERVRRTRIRWTPIASRFQPKRFNFETASVESAINKSVNEENVDEAGGWMDGWTDN